MHNTHLKLKKFIDDNIHHLRTIKTWKEIKIKLISELSIDPSLLDMKEIYDQIFSDKIIPCDNSRFIGYAVGYRACSKTCDCYKSRISNSVKLSKANMTSDEIKISNEKRKKTNTQRYGVDNYSKTDEFIAKSKQSFLHKYGVENPLQNEEIKDKVKNTNIERYGVENVSQNDSIKQKVKETNIERYGVENVSQNSEIQDKIKSTNIERYGVENPLQNDSIKQKVKETNIERYGVENVSHNHYVQCNISENLRNTYITKWSTEHNIIPCFETSDFLLQDYNEWHCNVCNQEKEIRFRNGSKHVKNNCTTCCPISIASIEEQQLKDFIISNNIIIEENVRNIIPPKEIDIFIPSLQLAIEYNGLYWHSEKRGKDKNYHRNKLELCNKNGIKLVSIFSDNWIYKTDIVKSRIKNLLGINQNKIYARKCTIKEITHKTASDFLIKNHLQGSCNAKINIGLFLNDMMISVMTFSKSRYEKDATELLRFASVLDTTVIGGASKLLKYYIKTYNPEKIITYSDNDWGYTDFYKKIGFTKVANNLPSYSYISEKESNVRMSRLQFQKHKLEKKLKIYDKTLSEYENMVYNGYDRIWDCGNTKWVLYPNQNNITKERKN